MIAVTKPSGETLEFVYNEVGSLVAFTDGRSETTTFVYDDLERLIEIVYPDSTKEEFLYDPVGNLESYTDPLGRTRTFIYDAADRLESIAYPHDLSSIDFTYDPSDNLLTLTERNGDVLSYEYDDIDRLVKTTRTTDSSNSTPEWEYRYDLDENGNVLKLTDGNDEILWEAGLEPSRYGTARYGEGRYAGVYDPMNRSLGYRVEEEQFIEFRYDADGRRVGTDFHNGATTELECDIVGRPLRYSIQSGENELLRLDYTYDPASNRTSQVSGNDTFDYQIDEDGRLIGEAVNRFVMNRLEELRQGDFDRVGLGPEGVELLGVDDAFQGDELDCDRWRVGYRRHTYPSSPPKDREELLGTQVTQNEGLSIVFPRGFANRLATRDQAHPLNDDFGVIYDRLHIVLEHRIPLEGDFDVQVDFSDFQGFASSGLASIGLYVSEVPRDSVATGAVALVERRHDNGGHRALTVFNNGSFTASSTVVTEGGFRLTRTGASVTGYFWNESTSTWDTISAWTRANFSSAPLYVGLATQTYYQGYIAGTFRNFRFNEHTANDFTEAGSVTSPVYDAGRAVAWDSIQWTEQTPADTAIELQAAFADSPDGPWNYVGPDGSPSTRFSDAQGESVAPSSIGRYCRYRAYLMGDGSATPTLEAVELSFSGALPSQHRKFIFDEAGNITGKVLRTATNSTEEVRVYNSLNQIVTNSIDDGSGETIWTYTHDPNGNLTSKTDGVDTYEYLWDDENRLIGVEHNSGPVVTYEYDSSSRLLQRVEGATTTNYHWDGWDLLREVKDDGVDIEITDYLVPEGEVLAFKRDGDWYYLHGDALSSTQLVTDDNGAQVARIVYSAWGEELHSSQSIPGLLENRFVGGLGVRNDSATGLIYMRHRWYDAGLGRFISRDPIGLAGGTNLYSYGGNNPLVFVDVEGLHPVVLGGAWLVWQAACASRAFNKAVDWAEQYSDSHKRACYGSSADRVQHCIASCLHNKCTGLIQVPVTWAGGAVWELQGVSCVGDLVADFYGTHYSYRLTSSCIAECETGFNEYGHYPE